MSSSYEVNNGFNTRYRGSEDDWPLTKKFIEAWRQESLTDLPLCYVKISDVNYVTDEKIGFDRRPHYQFETCFGDPDFWSTYSNGFVGMKITLIRPYNWFNPENDENEPGFIEVTLGVPTDNFTAPVELHHARMLESGYNHMTGTEHCRNEIVMSNDEATFSTHIDFGTFSIIGKTDD